MTDQILLPFSEFQEKVGLTGNSRIFMSRKTQTDRSLSVLKKKVSYRLPHREMELVHFWALNGANLFHKNGFL